MKNRTVRINELDPSKGPRAENYVSGYKPDPTVKTIPLERLRPSGTAVMSRDKSDHQIEAELDAHSDLLKAVLEYLPETDGEDEAETTVQRAIIRVENASRALNKNEDRIAELENLAYLGEHHHPDLTYKVRLEEAVSDLRVAQTQIDQMVEEREKIAMALEPGEMSLEPLADAVCEALRRRSAAINRCAHGLEQVRAALGHGADETLWPPGQTVGDAVQALVMTNRKLKEERESKEAIRLLAVNLSDCIRLLKTALANEGMISVRGMPDGTRETIDRAEALLVMGNA